MELAAWERAQQGFTVVTVKAPDPAGELVSLRLISGQSLEVPLSSERKQLHQVIRTALPDASPPHLNDERGAVPVKAPSHEIWAELLDDLGAYDHLLPEISPLLSLKSVDSDGLQATITLTDGDSTSTFTYPLEGGEVPFGLVTDLATDFLNQIERD